MKFYNPRPTTCAPNSRRFSARINPFRTSSEAKNARSKLSIARD